MVGSSANSGGCENLAPNGCIRRPKEVPPTGVNFCEARHPGDEKLVQASLL